MITGLVAEIGNHHLGDLGRAKELITAAKECGADFVKMQAIDSNEFLGGSMPRSFYRECDLGHRGYAQCLAHARVVGIPIFFSVFGRGYSWLSDLPDRPMKFAAAQFADMHPDVLEYWNDSGREIVASVREDDEEKLAKVAARIPDVNVMFASPYLPSVIDVSPIARFTATLGRQVGYSDHSPGITACLLAAEIAGARLIEKHFNLWGRQEYAGMLYRDSVHAANADQLRALANFLKTEVSNAVPNLSGSGELEVS